MKNQEINFASFLKNKPDDETFNRFIDALSGHYPFVLYSSHSYFPAKKTKLIAIMAHETAGCRGVSRVDFMIKDDKPYFLEINTSPGMTDTSDLPAQSAVMGIDYDNLVLTILNSAGINK